jgi:tetratricopeptide (TPR) repeat protein
LALKKFDELQQFLKQSGSGDIDDNGPMSVELSSICKEIAIICNILAMAHLHTDDFKMSQELLKKAELYSENGNPRIRAITFNNLACLFRKTKKLRNALSYLEKALEIEYRCLNHPPEEKEQDMRVEECLVISNPCEIHLNICAILSQMDKHDLALHHAMKALILI